MSSSPTIPFHYSSDEDDHNLQKLGHTPAHLKPDVEGRNEFQTIHLNNPELRQELLLGNNETLKRVLAAWDAGTLHYWQALCEAYGISSDHRERNLVMQEMVSEQRNCNAAPFTPSIGKIKRRMSESAIYNVEQFELSASTQLADILYIKSRVATELQALEQLRQELEDCEIPSEVHVKLEAAQKENATLRKKVDEFRNKLWDLAQYKVSKDQEIEELREQHQEIVMRLKQQHETGLKSLQRMYEDEKVSRTTSVLRALSESTGLSLSGDKDSTQLKIPPRPAAGSFSQYSSLVIISDDEDDDFDIPLSSKASKKLEEVTEAASDDSQDESMAPDSLADFVTEKTISKALSFLPEVVHVSLTNLQAKESKPDSPKVVDKEDEESDFVPREFYQRVVDELASLRKIISKYEHGLDKSLPTSDPPAKPISPGSFHSSDDGLSEKLRQLNDEVDRWDEVQVAAHSSPTKLPDVSDNKSYDVPLRIDHSIENWTFSLPVKNFGPGSETFSNVSEFSLNDVSIPVPQQVNNNAPTSNSSSSLKMEQNDSSFNPSITTQHMGVNTDLTLSGVNLSLESWQEALAKSLCEGVVHSATHLVEQEELLKAESKAWLERLEAQNSETLTALENERRQLAEKVQALKDEIQGIQAAHDEKMRQLRENYESQLDEKALELRDQIERLQNDNTRLSEIEGDVVQSQMEELKSTHYKEMVRLTEEHQRELDRIEAQYQLEQRISEVSRKKQVNELETALRTALEMKERTDAFDDVPSTIGLSNADKYIQVTLDISMDSPLLHCLECLCQGCQKFGILLQHVDDLQKYKEDWKQILPPIHELLSEESDSQRDIQLLINSQETADKLEQFPILMENICERINELLLNNNSVTSESVDREQLEEDYRRRQAHSDNLLSELQSEVDHLHKQLEVESNNNKKEIEDLKSQLQSAYRQQKALERFVEEQTRDRELEREDYEKELSALRIQRQQMQLTLRERKRSTEKTLTLLDKCTFVDLTSDSLHNMDALENEHSRVLRLLQEKKNILETIEKELSPLSHEENPKSKMKSNRVMDLIFTLRDDVLRLRKENENLHKVNGENSLATSVDSLLRLNKEKLLTLSKDYEHLNEKYKLALQELDTFRKANAPVPSMRSVHVEPRETFGSRCSATLSIGISNEVPSSWGEADNNKKAEGLSEVIKEKEARISELERLLAEKTSQPGKETILQRHVTSARAPSAVTYDEQIALLLSNANKDGQLSSLVRGVGSRPQSSALSMIAPMSYFDGGKGNFGELCSELMSNRVQALLERIRAEGQHLLTLSDVDIIDSPHLPQNINGNSVGISPYRNATADGCETISPVSSEIQKEPTNLNEEDGIPLDESVTLPMTITHNRSFPVHHLVHDDTVSNLNYHADEDLEKERKALIAATSALKELLNRIEQWHSLRAYVTDNRAPIDNHSSNKVSSDPSQNRPPGHEEDWRLSLLLAVQEAYTTDRELCATRLESLLRSVSANTASWGSLPNNNSFPKHDFDDEQDTLNDVNELTSRTQIQPPWLVLRDLLLQWQRQHQVALDRLYSTDRQSLLSEINHLKQLVRHTDEIPIHPLQSSSPLKDRSKVTRDASVSCIEEVATKNHVKRSPSKETGEIVRLKQQVEALNYRTKQAEEVSEELRNSYEREKLLNESLRDDRERLRRSLEDMRLRLSSTENRLSECRESLEEEQKLRFESLQTVEERRRSVNQLQHEIERVRREFSKCQNELNEEKSHLLEEKRKAEILERELLLIIDRYKEDLRKEQQSSETERQHLQKRIAALQRDMETIEKRASLSIKTGQELRDRALEENRMLSEKNAELQMLLEEKTQTSITQLREFEQLQRQVKKLRDDIEKKSADAHLSQQRQHASSRHVRNSRSLYLGSNASPTNERSSLINVFHDISPSSNEDVPNLQSLEQPISKYLEEVLLRVDQLQASVETLLNNILRRDSSNGLEGEPRGLREMLQQVINLRSFLLNRAFILNGFDGAENGPLGAYSGLSVTTLQYMITEQRNRADQGGLPHLELLPWELLFCDVANTSLSKLERQSSPVPVQKWHGPQLVYLLATMSAAQLQTQILLQASERLQILRLVEQLEHKVSDFSRLEQSRQKCLLSRSTDRATQHSPSIIPERLSSQQSSNSLNLTMQSDGRSPNTSVQQFSHPYKSYPYPAVSLKQHEEMHLRALRSESRCRALAFQKRYLVLLLKHISVSTLPSAPTYSSFNSLNYKDMNGGSERERAYWQLPCPLKPLQRFRAAVFVSIAVWRMHFQVNKWRFTANYFGLDSTQSSSSATRICIEPSVHLSINRSASDVAPSGDHFLHRQRGHSPVRPSGRITIVNESRNSQSQHSSFPMEHSNVNRISRTGRQSHSPPLLHHPVSNSSATNSIIIRRNISNAAQLRDPHSRFM